MNTRISRGKAHAIGDELDESERAVLIGAGKELKLRFWERHAYNKAIKKQRWDAALKNLCRADQEIVRLFLIQTAQEDPTLGKAARGVGRAFTVATGIQWTTGKEQLKWRDYQQIKAEKS